MAIEIGYKIYKNNKEEMKNYADVANTCNTNQWIIIDKGEYYEVEVLPEPTLDELKQSKHKKAGAIFAKKRDAIRQIKISDGNTYGFDCASEDITNFMVSWKAAEISGSTPYKVWEDIDKKGMIIMQLSDFETVFNVVRTSQLEAYAWYSDVDTQIQMCRTKEEIEEISLIEE